MKTLNLTKKNSTVRIDGFQGAEFLHTRLMQIGIHVGQKVQVLGQAPFSGPVLVKVGDIVLALRVSEAQGILVSETV